MRSGPALADVRPLFRIVVLRLDPKSGLPDFGFKLSKSETSDFDAIQYPRSVVTGSPGQSRAMTAQRLT
jgi:hypothetical protein